MVVNGSDESPPTGGSDQTDQRPSGEVRPEPEHDQLARKARGDLRPDLLAVLESAARLQQLVPDAILVGGTAAASYAGHRASYDHDHVLAALRENFDLVLDALESDSGWATNRITYGKIILGELGGIETGLRQLIRCKPLEVAEVSLATGATIRVPTRDETLRIKAFLITKRNQTRDFLDVAALADDMGAGAAAEVLIAIDDYYADQNKDEDGVSSQLVRQLSDPRPKDSTTIRQLGAYKGLSDKWHDWSATLAVCKDVAIRMVFEKE